MTIAFFGMPGEAAALRTAPNISLSCYSSHAALRSITSSRCEVMSYEIRQP